MMMILGRMFLKMLHNVMKMVTERFYNDYDDCRASVPECDGAVSFRTDGMEIQ